MADTIIHSLTPELQLLAKQLSQVTLEELNAKFAAGVPRSTDSKPPPRRITERGLKNLGATVYEFGRLATKGVLGFLGFFAMIYIGIYGSRLGLPGIIAGIVGLLMGFPIFFVIGWGIDTLWPPLYEPESGGA